MSFAFRVLCCSCLAALAACGGRTLITPYRMEIQQGNYVTQEMASQLKVGMTKEQVRFILGTPLIVDPFHNNRWDYVFRLEQDGKLHPLQEGFMAEHGLQCGYCTPGQVMAAEGLLRPSRWVVVLKQYRSPTIPTV